jgi:hypothetical protein
MKAATLLLASAGLALAATAVAKPLISVRSYNGKFEWLKIENLPASVLRSLSSAKSVSLTVSFPKDVAVKKDKGGNAWFTFVLADQGTDWAWHQTKAWGGVPVSNGTIKAGRYTVSIAAAGIPKAVLQGSKQTISLGPNTSGLVKPASFTIDAIKGG